jgi:hypothetical protein
MIFTYLRGLLICIDRGRCERTALEIRFNVALSPVGTIDPSSTEK